MNIITRILQFIQRKSRNTKNNNIEKQKKLKKTGLINMLNIINYPVEDEDSIEIKEEITTLLRMISKHIMRIDEIIEDKELVKEFNIFIDFEYRKKVLFKKIDKLLYGNYNDLYVEQLTEIINYYNKDRDRIFDFIQNNKNDKITNKQYRKHVINTIMKNKDRFRDIPLEMIEKMTTSDILNMEMEANKTKLKRIVSEFVQSNNYEKTIIRNYKSGIDLTNET